MRRRVAGGPCNGPRPVVLLGRFLFRAMSDHTFVQFAVGESVFGLPVGSVAEIVRVVAPAPVPGAHDDVLGMVNLRGRAVPVVELARALGLGSRPISLRMYIIVAEVERDLLGLLVDDVLDVVSVPADQYRSSRALAGEGSLAAGVASVGGSLLTVLELSPLLDRLGAAAPVRQT